MASGRVPRHEACGPCPFRGVESRRRRSAAYERIFFSNQKNIPSRFPRKIVRGDFDFPPDNPLETTKGRASALPLETFPEFREISGKRARALRCARLRGTLRRGTKDGDFGACGHSEHPALWETRATMARQISNRHWAFIALAPCVFPAFL